MAKTSGIVDVAALAAMTDGLPPTAASTATGMRASSWAIAVDVQSRRQPSIFDREVPLLGKAGFVRPCRNASARCAASAADRLIRKPTTGIGWRAR